MSREGDRSSQPTSSCHVCSRQVDGVRCGHCGAARELLPSAEEHSADEASLFAAVFADPTNDAPRQVLADFLLERGDPRGELINLQLRGADPRRQRVLLKQHGKTWLAPFGSSLGPGVEWRRGFPAKGVVRFRTQGDAERLGALPDWATFESLRWPPRHTWSAQALRWAHHVTKAFRHLREADGPLLSAMLDADVPWALEALAVWPSDDLERLWSSPHFPRLHTLTLLAPSLPHFENVSRLLNVKHLHVPFFEPWDRWLPVVNGLAGLETFWVGSTCRLTRDAQGQFTALELHVGPDTRPDSEPDSDSAAFAAQALPTGCITSVAFVGPVDAAVKAQLQSKVRTPGGVDPLAQRLAGVLEPIKGRAKLTWADERHVVVAVNERSFLVDVEQEREVRELRDRGGDLAFAHGRVWLSTYNDLTAWDVSGRQVARWPIPDRGPKLLVWSGTGRRLTRGKDVIDLETGQLVPARRGWKGLIRLPDDDAAFVRVAKPPQPQEHVVRFADGREPVTLEGGEAFEGLHVVGDGSVLSSARDGLVRWSLETGKRLALLPLQRGLYARIEPLEMTPDGALAWIWLAAGQVVVARAPSLELVAKLTVPADTQGVALSHDGKRLVAVVAGKLLVLPVA